MLYQLSYSRVAKADLPETRSPVKAKRAPPTSRCPAYPIRASSAAAAATSS